MKKVIRLNENDIEKIIKKIISEERKSINEGPLGWIKKKFYKDEGDDLNEAKRFLYHKFKECRLIQDSYDYTKYVNRKGNTLFADNIETDDEEKFLYFSYLKIYKKLKEMGLSYDQMKDLIKDMLWKVHKRKVDSVLIAVLVP